VAAARSEASAALAGWQPEAGRNFLGEKLMLMHFCGVDCSGGVPVLNRLRRGVRTQSARACMWEGSEGVNEGGECQISEDWR
jgi:hypothetical protein